MIVIVDVGLGNVGSIANMLKKIGVAARTSGDPVVIAGATKLVLPGVGSFDSGVRAIRERGLEDVLEEKARAERVPVLGICLGMQLLMERGEEGSLPGLAWISGDAIRFRFARPSPLRTPHMGWNRLSAQRQHPLLDGLAEAARFYFVHSYHVQCRDPGDVLAETQYGYAFPSIVARGNILGVQFHPEKSHRYGLQLFRNFVLLPATTGNEQTSRCA